MQDMEGIGWDKMNATSKKATDEAITFAICELKRALNKTLPGALQHFTADTGSYFDYAAMADGSLRWSHLLILSPLPNLLFVSKECLQNACKR